MWLGFLKRSNFVASSFIEKTHFEFYLIPVLEGARTSRPRRPQNINAKFVEDYTAKAVWPIQIYA